MQRIMGHVVDEEGCEHEVWVDTSADATIEHVYAMFGGAQVTDFPYNQPNKGCEMCEAAQMVVDCPGYSTISLPILVVAE